MRQRIIAFGSTILLAAALACQLGCGSPSGTSAPRAANGTVRVSGSSSGSSAVLVADAMNNRVLIYETPITTHQSASMILGQGDAVTGTPNTGGVFASTLFDPLGVAEYTNGDLIIADSMNSRVVLFEPPFATGMAAKTAFGQTSASAAPVYLGVAAATASSLDFPTGVVTDSQGNVWVVDNDDSRVLEYAPENGTFSDGQAAAVVIGQATAESTGVGATYGCNRASGGVPLDPTANTLCYPSAATFDSLGNLWVADGNNRILEYVPPFSTGMSASLVLGESDFVTASGGTTASTLYGTWAVAFDANGNLWVPDNGNNRVLEYVPPFSSGMSASLVLGQANFTTALAGSTESTFSGPTGLAFDSSGQLIVADSGNNRTLIFAPPFTTAMNATEVLGQANLTGRLPNQNGATPTAESQYTPYGVLAYR